MHRAGDIAGLKAPPAPREMIDAFVSLCLSVVCPSVVAASQLLRAAVRLPASALPVCLQRPGLDH